MTGLPSSASTEPKDPTDSISEDSKTLNKSHLLPLTPRLRSKTFDESSSSSQHAVLPPSTEANPPSSAVAKADTPKPAEESNTSQTNINVKTPTTKARSTAHLLATLAAQSTPFRALQEAVMQGRAYDWQIEQYWELANELEIREMERVRNEEDDAVIRETIHPDEHVVKTDGRAVVGGAGFANEVEEGEVVEDPDAGAVRGRARRRSSVGIMDCWYQGYLRGECPGGEVDEVTHLPWRTPEAERMYRSENSDRPAARSDAAAKSLTKHQTRRSESPERGCPSGSREADRTSRQHDGGSDDAEKRVPTDEKENLYDSHRRKRRATGGKLVEGIKLKTKLRVTTTSSGDADADAGEGSDGTDLGGIVRGRSCNRGHSRSLSRTRVGLGLSGLTPEGQVPQKDAGTKADEEGGDTDRTEENVDPDIIMGGADARGWRAEDAVEDTVLSERVSRGYRSVD